MTTTLRGLEATLRRWDIPYTNDDVVPGRPTGEFIPQAIMLHHTAPGGGTRLPYPSRQVVREGRTGTKPLPGPLYQLVMTRDLVLDIVTRGRANHAGEGGPWGGFISGNRSFVGLAFENLGTTAEPWRREVLQFGQLVCAALCDHLAIPATRIRAHFEWTDRKIDPRNFQMDPWRAGVARLVAAGPDVGTGDHPAQEDEAMKLSIAVYGERRFILDGNGKREVSKAAAAELVRAGAGELVTGLSAATLNEFPTYTETGTVGGSTQTDLDEADDVPAGAGGEG